MANVLLVSEGKLKAFTNINKNVDIDAIRAELSVAQDLHLQPLLGTKFYKHLLNQVSSTGNTFNADELVLVNAYISPFLINVSYFEMIPHLHVRTMNVGLVAPAGVDGGKQGVDMETMKYLRNIQKQRSEFYKQRLQDYLITGEGQNKFPDYLNYSTIDGMIPDKSSKYNSPIVLNHTTRYGYSKRGYPGRGGFGNLPSYSEIESSNPPCYDCY
jgi:hypothetical protein